MTEDFILQLMWDKGSSGLTTEKSKWKQDLKVEDSVPFSGKDE